MRFNFLAPFFCALAFNLQSQEVSSLWQSINEPGSGVKGIRQIVPKKYLTLQLDYDALKRQLSAAPHESNVNISRSPCIIELPFPSGGTQRFRVVEAPVMAPALAEAYPQIKTYSIKGIDDVYANGKIDFNEFGFHGMVLTVSGDYFIDPYSTGTTTEYISYFTADFEKDPSLVIPEAGVEGMPDASRKPAGAVNAAQSSAPATCVGALLRSYDLAVACTGEYAVAATGSATPTMAQTLAKIVTSVNRVDGVYEKEVSIRMVLVATQTNVVFTSASGDPFNGNNNSNTLLNESQTVINANIGAANYDIGHTFSTGGGGLANFGCVCDNANKARGITGSPSPVGDPYDIDYVAHEMGHQFRGSHTFNSITGSCNGNRNSNAAAEPGSGITIMGYAGLCSSNNLGNNSIPYFHAVSYDEIVNFAHSGTGGSCSSTISTSNQPPVVTGSGDFFIPKSTPFILTGSGSDPDGDALTFSWEETDLGATSGNWNSGNKPYFRSYTPTTTATRLFPTKNVAFSNNFTGTIGEYLPAKSQNLQFRLTARDNKMGGGGVCYAINNIFVDTSGPMMVTYPSATGITWSGGTQQTVTWDVNFTNYPPVSCDSVRVLLTMNNGATYTVLVNSVLNLGSCVVSVPTVTSTINSCRIRVESIGNIFYDVSNNNFAISPDPGAGIGELSADNQVGLSVWPNPFSDAISIMATRLDPSAPTTITITDVLGKQHGEFIRQGTSSLEEQIDLSELSNGVYFIRVSNNGRQGVYRALKL